MTHSSPSLPLANQLVVAFLDGRRLKGYALNFSPLRETFDLFPEQKAAGQQGTKVQMKDVKAVFFVKNFAGDAAYVEDHSVETRGPSKILEIAFADGETIIGATMTYNSQKLGFFLVPRDPKSNNARIFVVNQNVQKLRELRPSPVSPSAIPPASR